MVSAYIMNLGVQLWGKKWRSVILWSLRDGPLRFSEIKLELPGCSVKVLSEALSELEGNQLIIRTQYNTIPVRVTYHLHEDTMPIIVAHRTYRKFLATFLLARTEQYKLSEEVTRELKEMLVSPK
jgi:DNA-binding HxlR family transcriptional regulator